MNIEPCGGAIYVGGNCALRVIGALRAMPILFRRVTLTLVIRRDGRAGRFEEVNGIQTGYFRVENGRFRNGFGNGD